MIKVRYSKVCGRCMLREPLTSGMVGQTIHFEYSHDFDGLMTTAVFTDGKNTINVVNPGRECVIPHEVLTTVGATVKVGIYAVKDDELVIPTIYATIGTVLKGADPSGDISAEPTLPVWAQVQSDVGNLNDLTTEAKNNLVAAINEAAASGGGSVDWSQNDPDGDGYVKNRPGGYMTDPVITDVDTFTITSAESEDGMYFTVVAVESSTITLSDYTIGDGVIVDFGGQSYSLTWQSSEGYPTCGASVTDKGFDWSSAPFFIMAAFEDGGLLGYYIYLQNAVTSPIQVKLTMAKQTPVKIPEKYLELDSAKEILQFKISYNRSDDTYVSDRTYEELAAALNSGKLVVAKFGNVGMGELYSYGLLCQAGMYVAGLYVYVPSYQPYRWYCTKGNVWTKRRLLDLEMEIETPFYERDVGNVLTQVKSSGEDYKYKYVPKSIAGYGVKYIAEGYIGENNEFICTTSSEEVISRCSEIDDGCLCAIRIIDKDSYTIAIAEGGLCGDKGMTFSRVYTDGRGNLYTLCCSLNIESDTVSWSTYKHENITNNYIELPDVSADDDGKLLGVTGGAWGKVDKPSGGASEFVVNVTFVEDESGGISVALDKTSDQIIAAINEGKSVIARVEAEETSYLPLVSFDTISGNIIFAGVVRYEATDSILPIIYFLRLRNDEVTMYSSLTVALDPNGKMPQVSMASAPTRDMQIATKKYVDDKECILQSTTPGSTKKFKITVDDAGTLTATEVT